MFWLGHKQIYIPKLGLDWITDESSVMTKILTMLHLAHSFSLISSDVQRDFFIEIFISIWELRFSKISQGKEKSPVAQLIQFSAQQQKNR